MNREIDLTRQQQVILPLLNDGLSNDAIATRLGISQHTVKVHLWRLFRKLGVNSRGRAAKWWRERPVETETQGEEK